MKLESKYEIGDAVYGASYESVTLHEPCPDCNGTMLWTATSPNGLTLSVDCPTCWGAWGSTGKIGKHTVLPVARPLTIGRVTYESDFSPDGRADQMTFKYMCVETGVGSGQVYRESELYDNHDDAMVAARLKADEVKANIDRQNSERIEKEQKQAARRGRCPECGRRKL